MNTILSWGIGIVAFIAVLMVSVALHEAGHMSVAKYLKIPVPKYFVGFGPTMWSKTHKGTEYGIKWIPLGGFILVEDTNQPEDSPERALLSHVAPWKRILIFLAGPAVNLVLGSIILVSMLITTPYQSPTTTIKSINSCAQEKDNCQASKVGFKPGDKIESIDGHEITAANQIHSNFKSTGSTVVVSRNGNLVPIKVEANKIGKIGITLDSIEHNRTVGDSLQIMSNLFVKNFEGLKEIPNQAQVAAKSIVGADTRKPGSMSSVIGIGKTYGETTAEKTTTTENKFNSIVLISGLLNLGLGFANLLPLLPLDGGRVLIAILDSIKMAFKKVTRRNYSPIGYKAVGAFTVVTGTLVIGFMMLLIIADIVAPVPMQ